MQKPEGAPSVSALISRGSCTHGLSDDVTLLTEVVSKNYETREKVTSYSYRCNVHATSFGRHVVREKF